MPRKTHRPHDPAAGTAARLQRLARAEADERQASSAAPATWGVAEPALALPANAAVTTARDGRGRVAHAHRSDVFDRLHGRGALSDAGLVAARRLERDVGLRAGRFRPSSPMLVDSQGTAEGATQRMVEAGRRVETALAALGARQAALLRALVEPAMLRGELVDWREVTLRETGEKTPHGQAAAVRLACEDLASTYRAVDRCGRR